MQIEQAPDGASEFIGSPPEVTPESAPFWEAAREGKLVVDHCEKCDGNFFPPRAWCPVCATGDFIDSLHELRGPVRLYSFTVNHRAWLPTMNVPFVLGLAHFEDAPGVRIPCRVSISDLSKLRCDMLLDIGFVAGAEGFKVPSFMAREQEPEAA
jgi:uncharacterized OB-fold protein